MADGVLGLAGGGSAALNQDVIDDLKAAEAKATVEPWENKLETWDKEVEKVAEIEDKINNLYLSVKQFDLFSSEPNAFEQMTASTTGTAAVFDANDVSALTPGDINVNVSQLAQKDVYQTGEFSDKEAVISGTDENDTLSIQIGSDDAIEFKTDGKTYEELADEINATEGLTATIEQVGDESYRLIIKSTESGEANALTISQSGIDLKFSTQQTSQEFASTTDTLADGDLDIAVDGTTYTITTDGDSLESLRDKINSTDGLSDKVEASIVDNKLVLSNKTDTEYNIDITKDEVGLGFSNAVVKAQNMHATVDGVDYDLSSNSIKRDDGLTITAIELGDASISIARDDSYILSGVNEFIDAYNELSEIITTEQQDPESPIEDISGLKSILDNIKGQLFAGYGEDGDQNVFSYGFELDSTGKLSLDTETFSDAIANDYDDLKTLFVGTAENKGLGTQLKEYIDDMNAYDGIITNYDDSLIDKKERWEEERDKAQERLDNKYDLMEEQFAAYGTLIAQMEAEFSGLKMTIDQSNSSS